MERKLATVQVVQELNPIEGADLIEVATVKGWKLVTKKDEYKVGDLAIYCEIDSMLPIKEEFEFLRKSSFRTIAGKEGFRLKTIKLRGQVSQGLLLPLSVLQGVIDGNVYKTLQAGDDVTEALGIWKYELPIPAQLMGVMRGSFPSFIPKTDEERIQNLSAGYENFKRNEFYVTEKLDGSSATFYFNNGYFGVCSRNIDLLETEDNSFWKAARAMDMESVLSTMGNYCLQGELIGEGIQGNPYKLKGQQVYFFNAFNIDEQRYLTLPQFTDIAMRYSLPTVPILTTSFNLPDTIEELLLTADGKSIICPTTDREGLVIRSLSRNISFKVISNKWLLKEA